MDIILQYSYGALSSMFLFLNNPVKNEAMELIPIRRDASKNLRLCGKNMP